MKSLVKPPTPNGGTVCGSNSALAKAAQTVLVFQGGGALGAFQAGVYQALHEAGREPDWIIGTSIGAINASLIAGNAPENRLPRLREFWNRMASKPVLHEWPVWPQLAQTLAYWRTVTGGVSNFFEPRPFAFLGAHVQLGADNAGYYDTTPLQATLTDLVDFQQLGHGGTRLTVGAANVRTSQMTYFDSRDMPLNVRHIMASGALPPAFPPIRIDGELYWDGGILSNTPTEAVFDDYPRRDSLIFAVHLWNPAGPEPQTLWDVANRQKDVQYSSRVANHITRQKESHRLRHVINQLKEHIPAERLQDKAVRELTAYGCLTRMHVVRLLAPRLDNEDSTKDVDFSQSGIEKRWQAGYDNARRVIEQAPWQGEFDPLEGVILHEAEGEPAPAAATLPKAKPRTENGASDLANLTTN